MGRFVATKTFDHNDNLTCSYRTWRAQDSTRYLHGYSIKVKLVFECFELDSTDLVIDLDTIDEIKKWLLDTFSHTTCVADDDPEMELFKFMHLKDVIKLTVLPGVGCERFAQVIFDKITGMLLERNMFPRISIKTVEVNNHQGNSGLYLS